MFLTVGKSRESPAIYCQITSMRQILSHMDESGNYTAEYLQIFRQRLDELREIIKNDHEEGKHPEPVLKYMAKKLDGTGEWFHNNKGRLRGPGDRRQATWVA